MAATIRAAGLRASAVSMDVSDPAQVHAARARILADGGPIDVLVNNAGMVHGGPFTDVPLDRHLATYHVNILGLVTVTHAFLPDLRRPPDGARGQHRQRRPDSSGCPSAATYASSKWAVDRVLGVDPARTGMPWATAHVGVTTRLPELRHDGAVRRRQAAVAHAAADAPIAWRRRRYAPSSGAARSSSRR